MAASLAGAVKAHIEAQSLGIAVFRDSAPDNTEYPYITILEDISTVPDGVFNAYDDPQGHVSELVQVDIWQQSRNAAKVKVESYTLPDAVMKALHGTLLPTAPKQVSGCQVVSRTRLLEPENNIVHTALTVQVRRVLV